MTQLLKYITYFTITLVSLIIIALSGTTLYIATNLPQVDLLSEIKLQTPLRVYSSDGLLIGEFGDKKRIPVSQKEIPSTLKNAFLSAEDANFYEHNGISIKGIGRALIQAISQSETQTGGSTITQQVAKNYFLTPERTIIRKIREIFLAIKIEKKLSKDDILELYVNKIFLGNRAYGVGAAAQVYYGKTIDQLTIAEAAMIAGLPKAPSTSNPIRNPKRALERRNWILARMHKLGYIDDEELIIAQQTPVAAKKHATEIELYAPYVAEAARQKALKTLGEDAIHDGYKIVTTIDSSLQLKAQNALKKGLENYDWRHGYRPRKTILESTDPESINNFLKTTPIIDGIQPAVVTQIDEQQLEVTTVNNEKVLLKDLTDLSIFKPYINEDRKGPTPSSLKAIFSLGSTVYIRPNNTTWEIAQIPQIEGAFIALNPFDGAMLAMVGGYSFKKSKFNRVTQARRQMGSNMKPFIYSAAIHDKLSPASLINDAPIVFDDDNLDKAWRPTNDGGQFLGPTRLRVGLYRSRNLVSIRVLQKIGINYARNYLGRFGFEKYRLPKDLSLSLGSASFSPLEAARAYAVFANHGFLIDPYLIKRIIDIEDNIVYESNPKLACQDCQEQTAITSFKSALNQSPLIDSQLLTQKVNYAPRVIPAEDAFLIDSILRDVTKKGTGWRAGKALKRNDISGKTGTTNGPTDVWFSGYHPSVVAVSWAGFDNNANIGNREYGGTVALPIWIDFMTKALDGKAKEPLKPPKGIVSLLINKESGKRTSPGDPNAIFEYFKKNKLQRLQVEPTTPNQVEIEDIF